MNQVLEYAIRKVMWRELPLFVSEGEVVSVDKATRTCEVEREGNPKLTGVRLNSILEAGDNVLTIYPQAGSKVLCMLVENNPTDAYILSTTEIEEISGQIGEMKFKWNADGFVFNEGENGSFMILASVVEKLNAIEQLVNSLISKYNAHTHVTTATVGTGPVGVIASTTATESNTLTPTQETDLKNEKLKH